MKNKEIMKRIAIQGFQGSFHDIAAHKYFEGEQLQLTCCETFEGVFQETAKDPTLVAMLAIENTIAGSLLHNYDLLRSSGLTVVGEKKLHISHCICCLEEDSWETVDEVHSHPVALMQCRQFLSRHPELKAVEADDTAGAAMEIRDKRLRGKAAICSAYAAEMYGMRILENFIEDNKHNFTRFLVASSTQKADLMRSLEKADKASLVFALPHEEGSLSAVLSILTFYKINLTKIQSLPIIGHEWEYMFYVDVTFDSLTRYRQAVDAIEPLTRELKILGEYTHDEQ